MACNKCKEVKCLCSDHPLTTPSTFSNDPTICPENAETCSEVFDMKCVCYQGPDICQLDIKNGDRLEEVIRKILLSLGTMCTIPTNGTDGTDGTDGLDAEVNVIATNTLPSGSPATVDDSNPDPRIADLTFGIPEGSPGPGLDLDFDNPDSILVLDNTNMIFFGAWDNVSYYSGGNYGTLRYWNISVDVCFVQFYAIFDGDGAGILSGNRIMNNVAHIKITNLPFDPQGSDKYVVSSILRWNGKEDTTNFPALSGNLDWGSDNIPFVNAGVNELGISGTIDYFMRPIETHSSAAYKWELSYQGYIFKN